MSMRAGASATMGVFASSSVAPLRLTACGSATACCMVMCQSMSAMSVWVTKPMMRLPPGEPMAAKSLPSGPNTSVGDMDERGRLFASTRLATGIPSFSGRKEKSVSWLLRMKPAAMMWAPKGCSTVVVMETALPDPSTMERWLVPCSMSGSEGARRALASGGLPASAVPMSWPGSISRSRDLR